MEILEMCGMWEGLLPKGSSSEAHKITSIEASEGGGKWKWKQLFKHNR